MCLCEIRRGTGIERETAKEYIRGVRLLINKKLHCWYSFVISDCNVKIDRQLDPK